MQKMSAVGGGGLAERDLDSGKLEEELPDGSGSVIRV